EEARRRWELPPFTRRGVALESAGRRGSVDVVLQAPLTYVNRSGDALTARLEDPAFDPRRDLLVVVDDVSLDVGRIRIRAQGSAGGHNGLKSIEAALGSAEYARLRIGVGAPPPGLDLARWVLSPPLADEEATIVALLPELVAALDAWIAQGAEAAARGHNR
ncbi:MAG TPA: aminoacyl-tRNA hydrolase, partial [Vicinamibacterales bacterium]